jgi:TolB-like protein
MPFQNVGKRNFLAGTVISEKLGSQVMALGQVEVVERTLLAEIMREQKLQHSGAVDRGSIKELGRVLGVEAIVAGTVMELRDGRFEVNCRLIETQTARVLAAAIAKVDKDWAESLFDDFSIGAMPAWTSFELASPAAAAEFDAGVEDCGDAQDAVMDMDRSILDVKARYWAGRLKARDIKRDSLKKNPGSEIHDPELRKEFYRELHRYYEEPELRPLSGADISRMQRTQKEIERLAESCGLSGA